MIFDPSASNTMPINEAPGGGFFAYANHSRYTACNKTRQGYALLSTLKPAGYLFLES